MQVKILAGFGVLAVAAGAAVAQPIIITQSVVPNFGAPGSIGCASDPMQPTQQTSENGYSRSFDLTQYLTAGNDLEILSIDFGVEAAIHPNLTQDVTVNIFIDPAPASPIIYSGLQLVSSMTVSIPDTAANIVINAPFGSPVQVCGESTIVVEIVSPDYSSLTENAVFFIGSNSFGQTAPSFIRAPACGAANPTNLAALNFPDMHIDMSINGNEVPSTMCSTQCYADCDLNNSLNIFDYICFGSAYSSQTAYADCDGNSLWNVFDYICFGSEYAAGCP